MPVSQTAQAQPYPGPFRDAPDASPPASRLTVAALLEGLNREQRRAVTHGTGPLVVLAGPGTGKTEVVTRRIAWLIAAKLARPREILALTFTDNAAQEMQARVDVLVPYGQADTHINTLHAFGDRLLREYSLELGLPGDVRLVTRSELAVLVREHLFELGLERYRPLGDPTRFIDALVDLFLRAKDEDISPAALAEHATQLVLLAQRESGDAAVLRDLAEARSELGVAYQGYVDLMANRGLIDHADQIALALRLLRDRPSVRQAVASQYRFVLVDELQDTNRSQLELVLALAGRERNVTVVGDSDQGIYAFRGAVVTNVDRFVAAMPTATRVVLRRNYRSRRPILEASARLLAHAAAQPAWLARPDQLAHRRSRQPAPVRCEVYGTFEEEADAIAGQIADRARRGEKPSDFAVLLRSNNETEVMLRSLRVRGLPAHNGSRTSIFDLPAVRALLAYLRVVADPSASLELYLLAGSAPYGLGSAELGRLLHAARRRHRTLWDMLEQLGDGANTENLPTDQLSRAAMLVEHVNAGVADSGSHTSGEVLYSHLRRSGLLGRLARVDPSAADATNARGVARFFELVQSRASLLAEDRVAFLVPHLERGVDTRDELDDADPYEERVSVLTVHRAKGLEFKVVFICGLVDGRFPVRRRPPALSLPVELVSHGADADGDHLAEERRLFYVAITRARDELWLSYHTGDRKGRGRCRPSPFIAETLDTPPAAPQAEPNRDRMGDDLMTALGRAAQVAPPPALPVAAQGGPLSLSYSQFDEYLGCPERYRLHHVMGLPVPAHHALAYGTAMHHAVAAFHVSQARHTPLTEEQLLAEFERSWTAEGFLSREHEDARYLAGQNALRRFRAGQLAVGAVPPVAVERPFSFRLGDDLVRGRMDRIDGGPDGVVITDYKTSDVHDQRRADAKARDSLQLDVYALAHEAETGTLPREMRLHFLDTGLVGHTKPDGERLEKSRQKLAQAADSIRAGRFDPKPNPVACGYCPYRTICAASAA